LGDQQADISCTDQLTCGSETIRAQPF
jgi:hypothetical protein